ncbi:cytochrome c551 [Brevibacillus migulae]|uniref:cytochrome c551 n=1 Tax=Brevibacillus migulae TaxID=1644114 RepID=UPI00106DE121|nr:cytochrome c [Brevibacillus migulae]
MNRLWGFVAAGALTVALSACGGGNNNQAQQPSGQPATETPATETPPATGGNATYDAAAAEAAFKNKCASCHGQNLEGMVGPNLTAVGSKYSRDQILEIIEKGKGGMPPGMATGTDAEALASWLADKK